MPARKKDASARSRRNTAASAATLSRRTLRSVDDLTDLTVAQLRAKLEELNTGRPADQQLEVKGRKADLAERIIAAESDVPPMPEHPPLWDEDAGEIPTDWHAQTIAWWNDVWTSPMESAWDESDVHNVYVVALLYDDIWTARSPKERKEALGEYRLQRADLGLSPYSRRRLEWTIEGAREAQERGEKRRQSKGQQPAGPSTTGTGADPRHGLTSVK